MMENDKQTLVENYIDFENKNIFTIHEEKDHDLKKEEDVHLEEKKDKLYIFKILYQIFYQMICVNQSSFELSSSTKAD
jgi:hypothetical protein